MDAFGRWQVPMHKLTSSLSPDPVPVQYHPCPLPAVDEASHNGPHSNPEEKCCTDAFKVRNSQMLPVKQKRQSQNDSGYQCGDGQPTRYREHAREKLDQRFHT